MATRTVTFQQTTIRHGIQTEPWLLPAVMQNSEHQYIVDYDRLLHRIEKVIMLLLPTLWGTYQFFHWHLDAQSSFCLALICCVPLPDLYFFFELFRAERMAASKNLTAKTISIPYQRTVEDWRRAHREFS